MHRVGLIGLGKMGLPIARNLMERGFEVTGYRRSGSPELADAGGTVAGSPAEVASAADVLMSIVPDAAAVEEVICGPSGTLSTLRPGTIHGLTCDQFVALELVLASGEVIEVSADSHPDLFWALRGGGGNFGIVTRFTFAAHDFGPMMRIGGIPLRRGARGGGAARVRGAGAGAAAHGRLARGAQARHARPAVRPAGDRGPAGGDALLDATRPATASTSR